MTPSKDKPKKVGTPITPPNLFPVVGVGASAGGLDAFKRRSINEDQESTNEELQSANQELAVLNQELISLNEQVRTERDYFESIIATIVEPLLVLDKNLRVKSANSAFYKTFQVNEAETEAKLVYELGNNQWDIPKLRTLLETILPEKEKFMNFEVTHQFRSIGQRVMLLNAREIKRENEQDKLILLAIEDITERKEADYHRSMLSALVDSSDDAIISKTLDGIITTWNNGAERIFGYKAKEAIGKHISILIPNRLLAEEDMIIDKIKKNESLNHYETQRLAKDGTSIDISLTISPIKDKEGRVIGASKIARDISDQRIARKKIEESEQRYNRLIYSSPSLISILKGKDMVIDIANDAILDSWGKGKDIIGKSLFDVMPEAKEQGFDKLLNSVYQTGKPVYAYETPITLIRFGKPEVMHYTFVYQAQRNANDEIEGVAIIANEVNTQVEAKNKLKESEENFKQLTELMPDKVCIADSEGNINYFNRNWRQFTALSIERLMKAGWQKLVHPDDLEKSRNFWGPSIGTHNTLETELRLLNKNGEYKWHLCRISAVKDNNGKATKWIVAATEIQQQKLQEENLEKSVADRTQQLLNANKTLEQKNAEFERVNKELEAFTYVSSHDLQEPLRKIQTFAERILKTENEALSLAGKDYFDRIFTTAERMRKLIEDLLAFSRVNTADRIFETVNLDDIVELVKIDLKENIEEKRATIKAKSMCKVRAIPFQFHQLMHNIISNALKYSEPDTPPHIIIKGRKITCDKTDDAQLKFGKVYCHISISDNGIGFDPDLSNRIFKVFQQLHRKDEYAGTGIGLAIVKKIVEYHNGFITATGELGKGATFDIYIPE